MFCRQGVMRRFIRRVSDYRKGCTTLCHKDDDFKYKLTIHPDGPRITFRRRTRDASKQTAYYAVDFINMYRAYGSFVADGAFSVSPGTEFIMAMLGPCTAALGADTGSKKIIAVVETSCMDVIVESWGKNGVVAPMQYAKYHIKFKLDCCDEEESEEEELPPAHTGPKRRSEEWTEHKEPNRRSDEWVPKRRSDAWAEHKEPNRRSDEWVPKRRSDAWVEHKEPKRRSDAWAEHKEPKRRSDEWV